MRLRKKVLSVLVPGNAHSSPPCHVSEGPGTIEGLDKRIGIHRMAFMQPCQHARTEILARRDSVEYVRCLDCDQVFEAEDLEAVPAYDDD